jgi:CheY-like chemotaxis protein/anti-sigma regulatory factor (Ser/Thr protein kinase)
LATELHDHLQQILVLGKLQIGQGRGQAQSIPACAEVLKQLDEVLSEALAYTRTLVVELSPPVLREHGLMAGLKWLGDYMRKHRMTVTVTVRDQGEPALPEDQAVLLFQSVRELLINSSKHGGTGEATVTVEQWEGQLRIEVRDEGAGFDLAAAAAVGASTGGLSSKFGLLSIRERMKALGGAFDIQSAPGKGVRATLLLPLAAAPGSGLSGEAAPAAVGHQAGRAGNAGGSILGPQPSMLQEQVPVRVLLVDDHVMVRQGLRSLLDGYPDVDVIGEAWDGEEAVAAVEQLRPRVVVMDINMPKKNGIEATVEIKARHPDIEVIGLSVNAGGDNQAAMLKAGASRVLTKEAAVEYLYGAIQQAVKSA